MGLPAHRAWWQLWHQPPALPQPLLVVGNGAFAHLGHSLGWGLSKGQGMASNKCFLMHFLDEAEKAFRVKIVRLLYSGLWQHLGVLREESKVAPDEPSAEWMA